MSQQNLASSLSACQSQADLATFFGTSKQNLLFHLYSAKRPRYRIFKIPKASGDQRVISVPPPVVARWQRRLHLVLTEMYVPKAAAHGFVLTRSIASNARRHVRRELLLNVDVENFFGSIHFGRVRGMFGKPPFSFPGVVAATLAQLCTDTGTLPQGSPTSPMISNFICRRFDNDLLRLAGKHRCVYTRFADDISVSTQELAFHESIVKSFDSYGADVTLGAELVALFGKHKFTVNAKKTRVQSRHRRQEVTGLIVNRRLNVPRIYTRRLRSIIHGWRKFGKTGAETVFKTLDAGRKTRSGASPDIRSHLRGKIEFLRMVRGGGDLIYTKYALAASKLVGYDLPGRIEGAAAAIFEFYREALWVVVGRDALGSLISQGTAFFLDGVGFVSALHVLYPADSSITKWTLIRGCAPYDEFAVVGCTRHPALDLTILQTDARTHALLRGDEGQTLPGQAVVVLGFPNWHTSADKPLRADALIVQQKTISACKLASVNYPLLSGASGGPVLNAEGWVVGVTVHNATSPVLPNSFLAIEHFASIVGSPFHAL